MSLQRILLGNGSVPTMCSTMPGMMSTVLFAGMTRFATFWVEGGRIVAPIDVLRFDDTLYRILGDQLEALTAETEFILDSSTYRCRSLSSMHLPGALVSELAFTL